MATLPLHMQTGHPDTVLPQSWFTLDVILADDFPRA